MNQTPKQMLLFIVTSYEDFINSAGGDQDDLDVLDNIEEIKEYINNLPEN